MLSYKINVKLAVCRKLITKNTYVVLIPEGQSKCNFRKISWTRFNDGNIHKITNRNTRFTNETDTFFNSGLQTPTIGESDVVETGCRISKSRITIVLDYIFQRPDKLLNSSSSLHILQDSKYFYSTLVYPWLELLMIPRQCSSSPSLSLVLQGPSQCCSSCSMGFCCSTFLIHLHRHFVIRQRHVVFKDLFFVILQHSRLYRRVDITHLFYSISLVLMIYSADLQTLFFF